MVTAVTRAATAHAQPAPRPSAGTHRVVVRPVTSQGRPMRGYRVVNETIPGFICNDGPSPAAVSPNIRFCGSSATNTVACWKSATPSTVLCLRDPQGRTLVSIKAAGRFAAIAATNHPVPQSLLLDNGTHCLIRDGGAWSAVPGHASWVGWYYCAGAANVYGPRTGDGIDRAEPTWTVHIVETSAGKPATISRHLVKTAYYVGTA
jgi:hypothetical protein